MILVELANGDNCEADTCQRAVSAAARLWDEAHWINCRPCVTFTFENKQTLVVHDRSKLCVSSITPPKR